MNLNDIKIDPARLEDGAWVGDLPNMGDLELKVRGVGNKLYRTREAELLKKVPRSKRGELDIADGDRITTTLLLETVLLDWRGIVDGDQPLPYSREMAEKLLTDPAWRNFRAAVAYAGAIVAQETAVNQDADIKN